MIKTYSIKKAKIIKKLLKKDYQNTHCKITKKRIYEINQKINNCLTDIHNKVNENNNLNYINEIYIMYFN